MNLLTPHKFHALCYLLFFASSVWATSIKPFDANSEQLIDRGLYILQDPTFMVDIIAAKNSRDFDKLERGIPNLGLNPNAQWIKFYCENNSNVDELVLRIGHIDIDEIDLYLVRPYSIDALGFTGQLRRPTWKERSDLAFSLPLKHGEGANIYMRIRGKKQIHLPIYVGPEYHLLSSVSKKKFFIGGLLAIMVVMALYNLFIYFSTRDKSYMWYVLTIVTTGMAQLLLMGFGNDMWPESPWFASRIFIFFAMTAVMTGVEFARQFIGKEQEPRWIKRMASVLYMTMVAVIITYYFFDEVIGYEFADMLSGICALFLLIYVGLAMRKGNRQARFYLIAWVPFLFGVILFVMKDVGALPYSDLTVYAMPAGAALEIILLSFGLAEKIRQLRFEKEASQKEALKQAKENEQLIKTQNMVLEIKVNERTAELRQTNEELKMTQSQLVDAEKMASLGQLTAGIAHEINNPINFITSNIPPLRRDLKELIEVFNEQKSYIEQQDDERSKELVALSSEYDIDFTIDELSEIIGSIDEGARRTMEIVRGLRNFSRLDEDDSKQADVNIGVRSTIGFLPPELRANVEIRQSLEEIGEVECLPGKLNQLILNLVTNGLQAIQSKFGDTPGGLLEVSTSRDGDNFVLCVSDNGCGMSEKVKEKVFEPFFTTKDVGEGTGLGLSISHGIAESHGGSFTVTSEPKEGTTFTLTFPILEHKFKKSA